MVLNRTLEVEQWPHNVVGTHFWTGMRVQFCVLKTQCGPIPQGRIFELHVGFDTNDGLSGAKFSIEHAFPKDEVVRDWLRPAGTIRFRDTKFFEFICRTTANITKSFFQHRGGMAVIFLNTVRRENNPVGFSSCQPLRLFLNDVVSLKHRRLDLGIGVVKSENKFALIRFSITAVDDQSTSVAKGQRAIWVGCKTEHDLSLFCVFEVG